MTIAPKPTCQHTYACTLTQNACIWCGHVQGQPEGSES